MPGIIRRDELVTTTIMKDYFDFKDRLSTSSGYTFGFDYTTALQTGISGNRNETAFSGIFRAFGGWTLSLLKKAVFKVSMNSFMKPCSSHRCDKHPKKSPPDKTANLYANLET